MVAVGNLLGHPPASKDGVTQPAHIKDDGSGSLLFFLSLLEAENTELKEKMFAMELAEKNVQSVAAKLQRELRHFKLQLSSSTLSHNAVVDALETAAEEQQEARSFHIEELEEKVFAVELADKKVQRTVAALQQELDHVRLQLSSSDVSHEAIVNALEEVAEEQQEILTCHIKELEEKVSAMELADKNVQHTVTDLQRELNNVRLQLSSKDLSHNTVVDALEEAAEEQQEVLTSHIEELEEKVFAMKLADKKLQRTVTELQKELNHYKLQKISKDRSHNAIVDALEAVAEEEQATLSPEIKQLEEKLQKATNNYIAFENSSSSLFNSMDHILNACDEIQDNETQITEELDEARKEHDVLLSPGEILVENSYQLESESNCAKLRNEISNLIQQNSELCQILVKEKRRSVEQVVLHQDLVDAVNQLEGEKEDLVRCNAALETEKDQYVSECEDKENHLDRLREYLEALAVCRMTQDEPLNEFQDKKSRRNGWTKLKFWK